jgi:hypothetical protein
MCKSLEICMKIDPPHPTTVIPELQVMELSEKQYETAVMIVGAASKIQAARLNPDGGPNLRWRIELAAAFLASAIDHAISAAEANDANCEYMMDLAIDLTVRRAQEIFGQGGA